LSLVSLEKYFLSHIKLLPWTQFVGTNFAYLCLLMFSNNVPPALLGKTGVIAGTSLAALAFMVHLLQTRKFGALPNLLQVLGFGGALALSLRLDHPLTILTFVALAVTQAGQWYDSLYP